MGVNIGNTTSASNGRKGGRPVGSKDSYPRKQVLPGYHEVAMHARTMSIEAIDFIAGVMRNEQVHLGLRVHCAKELLDRGWGKPPQAIQLQSYQQRTVNFTTSDEIKAEILRRGLGPVLGIPHEQLRPVVDVTPEKVNGGESVTPEKANGGEHGSE